MVCQRGAVRVRRRGGLGRAGQGRNARGRGARPWCAAGRGVTRGWRWFGGIAETVTSCNSPGTRIGLPGPSRAYQLARWHRFVSIERREPLQTALQGTFARAMISRKITEDQRPATHDPQSPVSAQTLAFLQFILHLNRPSRALQGISARAMASICVHRAPRTPPDSPPGHISSRDVIDLCPSRTANPSRQRSRVHSLARCFAGRLPKISDRPHTALRDRLVLG